MSERRTRPAAARALVRRAAPVAVIALLLLSQWQTLAGRLLFLPELITLVRLWPNPEAQQRAQLGPDLYEFLTAADRILPPDATVLLVTPGRDTRHREYVAFHRALYHLAPRPVWWVAPAGTDRRPQWWTHAELTPEALAAVSETRGATYLLFYDVAAPPGVGHHIADLGPHGKLFQLESPPPAPAARLPSYAGRDWPLRLLAALGLIYLAGHTALVPLARRGLALPTPAGPALAWTLGCGLISLGLLLLNALGLPLGQQVLVLSLAVITTFLLTSHAAKLHPHPLDPHTPPSTPNPQSPISLALLLIILAGLLYVAIASVGRPFIYWDSWVTWGMKARIIFRVGHIAEGVYADPSRAVTHLDYPLLLPLLEAWTFQWLGAPDDRLGGAHAGFFYAALLGVCYAALRRWGAKRRLALFVTATLAVTPAMISVASYVFADLPLALYTTTALVAVVGWLEGGPRGMLLLAGIAGGLMPWTKREGLLLLALIGAGAVVLGGRVDAQPAGFNPTSRWSCGRRAGLLVAAVLAIGAATLAGPWLSFLAAHRVGNTDFLPLSLETLAEHAARLPVIVRLMAGRLARPEWSYLWPILACVVVVAWRPRRRPSDLLLYVTLGYLLLMGSAYMLSAMLPFEAHLLSSADRLLVHVAPAAVLWLGRWWLGESQAGRAS